MRNSVLMSWILAFAALASPAIAQNSKPVLLDVDSGYGNSSATAVAPGVIVGAAATENGPYGPAVWEGSTHRFRALFFSHSAVSALIRATDGAQHAGMQYLFNPSRGIDRTEAALWDAAGLHSLHQDGWEFSDAYAVAGGEQGGIAATNTGRSLATIWSGTPESARSVNPVGAADSVIFGMAIGVQVGAADIETSPGRYLPHAALWSGSAESFVDLHPPGAMGSEALGTDGAQHAGFVIRDGLRGAAVWTGISADPIDLRSAGFVESEARGVRAGVQVGFATGADGLPHALTWRGSADSVTDLHAQLPRGFILSYAYGIDDEGSVVGEAMGPEWGEWHAVLWKVPVDAVRLSDFLPPLQGLRGDWTARYGSVVPVKIQARDAKGAPVKGLSISLTVTELGPVGAAPTATTGRVVRDVVMLQDNGVYDYELDTSGLFPGYRYRLTASAPGSTVPRQAGLVIE